MRRLSLALAGGSLLLAGAFVGALWQGRTLPAAQAQVPAASFEYQTASTKSFDTEERADKVLNSFSREGFRFVGAVNSLLVFERPRVVRAAPRPQPRPESKNPESVD